jgi:hypothetical protein
VGSNSLLAPLYAAVMENFEWEAASIVYVNDALNRPTAASLQEYFAANTPVTIVSTHSFEPDTADSTERLGIIDALHNSGVRVVYLLGLCGDMRRYLLDAFDTDSLRGYAYLTIDATSDCHMATDPDGRDSDALVAMSGVITAVMAPPTGTAYDAFSAELRARRDEFAPFLPPPAGTAPILVPDDFLPNPFNESYFIRSEADAPTGSSYGSFLHDAILLYALALNHTLSLGQNHLDYRNIMAAIDAVTPFEGASGSVVLDANHDRFPDGMLQYLHADGSLLVKTDLGRLPAGLSGMVSYQPLASSWTLANLVWPGGRTTVPVAQRATVPLCDSSFMRPVAGECDPGTMSVDVAFQWRWLLGDDDFSVGDDDLIASQPRCSGGAALPDTQRLTCSYMPIGSAPANMAIVLGVLGLLLVAGTAAWICSFRKKEIVAKAHPVATSVFVAASFFATFGLFPLVGRNTRTTCVARDIFCRFPLVLALSAVVVRLRAGNRMIQSSKPELRHRRIGPAVLETAVIAAPYLFVLVVHEAVARPVPEERVVDDGANQISLLFCSSAALEATPTSALLFALAGLLCLYACFLATSVLGSVKLAAAIWSMQNRTSDSRHAAMAVYLLSAFVMLLHVTPSFVGDSAALLTSLQAVWLFLGATLPVLIQWVPRMFMAALDLVEQSLSGSAKDGHSSAIHGIRRRISLGSSGSPVAPVLQSADFGDSLVRPVARSRGGGLARVAASDARTGDAAPASAASARAKHGASVDNLSNEELAGGVSSSMCSRSNNRESLPSALEMLHAAAEQHNEVYRSGESSPSTSNDAGSTKALHRTIEDLPIYGLMRDTAHLAMVQQVAVRQRCEEAVQFALETRAFRKAHWAGKTTLQFERYKAICERFLTAGAALEVNVSGTLKHRATAFTDRPLEFAALSPQQRRMMLALTEAEVLFVLSGNLMPVLHAEGMCGRQTHEQHEVHEAHEAHEAHQAHQAHQVQQVQQQRELAL